MRVWIDIENAPQVLFFKPLRLALAAEGRPLFVTARRERVLVELCAREGWKVDRFVGRRHGHGTWGKVAGGLGRAAGLACAVRGFQPSVLVSCVSRPAVLAAAALGVPIFTFFDYEHVALPLVGRLSRTVCLPTDVAPGDLKSLGIPEDKVLWFPAAKEELYAAGLRPTPVRGQIQVPEQCAFALIRPPARTAHYHDPRSEAIHDAVLERIDRDGHAHARVLGRNEDDRLRLLARFPDHPRIRHLDPTQDGLNLIWNADLVVSGGGTMTREAAALGVPAYSIFSGPLGAVDRRLFAAGRIVHVGSLAEVDRIRLEQAPRPASAPAERADLVDILVRGIERTSRN